MIFCIHDWMGRDVKQFAGVKTKQVEWKVKKGTKKQPVQGKETATISYVEFETIDQLVKFMQENRIMIQIQLPAIDSQGNGFPYPYIYTDSNSGKFHQR